MNGFDGNEKGAFYDLTCVDGQRFGRSLFDGIRFPLGPRPMEWIDKWRTETNLYICDGWRNHNWLPVMEEPGPENGCIHKDKRAFELKMVIHRMQNPANKFKARLSYGYSIVKTIIGRVRVDYLCDERGMVCGHLFLLNHEGVDIGGSGILIKIGSFPRRNFPSGVLHNKHVFQVAISNVNARYDENLSLNIYSKCG